MSVNHRDLDLGFFQRIIMRKVRLFGLKKHLVKMPNRYKFLYYYSLVEENPKNRTRMKLSEKGKMYLRFHFKSFFAFWIPTGISFLALLAGYGVYVNPFIQKVLVSGSLLLKTILEGLGSVL